MGQQPVDPAVKHDVAPEVGGQVAPVVVLRKDEQRRYERFRKMHPPQFQGRKGEDTHEFLTTCRELLEVVGLPESHMVFDMLHFSFMGHRGSGEGLIWGTSS